MALLFQPPDCWDYRHASPHPALDSSPKGPDVPRAARFYEAYQGVSYKEVVLFQCHRVVYFLCHTDQII
jgi:hypothetical protein